MSALRWIVGIVLFVALLLFSLQNADPVTLRLYHGWNWQAPLIFMLLLAFALGAAAGLLAGSARVARFKRTIARLRRLRHDVPPPSVVARNDGKARPVGYGPVEPFDGV